MSSTHKTLPRIPEEDIKKGPKLMAHASVTGLALLLVLALSQFRLASLNGLIVDLLFRTQWWSNPDPDIALIAYDDDSSLRYEGLNKLPAREISKIFQFLASENPKAIAILAPVNDKTYSKSDLLLIAESFKRFPSTYVGYTDDESLGKTPSSILAPKSQFFPGYISRDKFSYGADAVTRRVMITIDGVPTIYAKLAGYPTPKERVLDVSERTFTHPIIESLQTYINWQGRAGTYRAYSSQSVAEHEIPRGTFDGKIVLVGTVLRAKRGDDFISTPYSRARYGTTQLEGAAHSLVTLIRRNGIIRTNYWFNLLLALLVATATVNMVSWLSPARGILFVMAEGAALLLSAWILLFGFHVWLELAHPLIVACVGYYLVVPYRLVEEYRKRWHYQEKSELMVQVEQLKSNFLSLISHDLKTPISRIQGNAELALSDPHEASEKQRKCLSAIIQTTEDLSRYVETVLDLTRVESSQLPLKKVTKDINATILEVIEDKRSLASEKDIRLEADLEPLFSIKFDVKLIQQVISNLVENAIKYSPRGTRIILSSSEENDWVLVSVTDEGIGISQYEKDKVFSKFYRGDRDEVKKVKGTGLGLYLVKYFVELHEGVIDLTTELGKGSTFTIRLPV